MGPPPNYVITRRLIRNFFKAYIPNTPEGSNTSQEALFDCWVPINIEKQKYYLQRKFGVDHPNCLDAENALGDAIEAKQNYRDRLDKLRIRQKVMSQLKRPTYPNEQKGRYKQAFYNKEWTIFDGIKS